MSWHKMRKKIIEQLSPTMGMSTRQLADRNCLEIREMAGVLGSMRRDGVIVRIEDGTWRVSRTELRRIAEDGSC